jgi:hypothetical protein
VDANNSCPVSKVHDDDDLAFARTAINPCQEICRPEQKVFETSGGAAPSVAVMIPLGDSPIVSF